MSKTADTIKKEPDVITGYIASIELVEQRISILTNENDDIKKAFNLYATGSLYSELYDLAWHQMVEKAKAFCSFTYEGRVLMSYTLIEKRPYQVKPKATRERKN